MYVGHYIACAVIYLESSIYATLRARKRVGQGQRNQTQNPGCYCESEDCVAYVIHAASAIWCKSYGALM